MIDSKTLGRRIKYFRKRASLSQMDLELAMNASAGMISRIESGKVNPSKETVMKMAELLDMNSREIDYLIGITAEPATPKEIEEAINFIRDHFARDDVFAYLRDERFRFYSFSKGFENLFTPFLKKSIPELEKELYGIPIARILLDDKVEISSKIKADEKLLQFQFARFYSETNYMTDDLIIKGIVEFIENHPIGQEIWGYIKNNKVNVNSLDSKYMPFKLGLFKFKMRYAREPLPGRLSRFQTLEYFPNIRILNFMKKLNK